MSDGSPVPIVLCGRFPDVAAAFKASVRPEYEVIHIILTFEAGFSDLPALLRGEKPPPGHEENLGTRNYSKPPVAIVTGGAYDDTTIEEMRKACRGGRKVPWLRPDMDARPPQGAGYATAMGEKAKACLGQVAKEGKMDEDGIYFY